KKGGPCVDNFGFIHGELDIKILILFVLRRLPAPVDSRELAELCSCDTGIGYFDYTDCLAHLVETEHVEITSPGFYGITDKGERNGATAESSLPYSVRKKAERLIAPVAEEMRRSRMIKASHSGKDSSFKVSLALADGKGEIISMDLLVADETQATLVEKNFRARAELIYGKIMEILTEG
ncbi:MAG: DUF4364 family protein, partial [Oscillospiraceae bacterium]